MSERIGDLEQSLRSWERRNGFRTLLLLLVPLLAVGLAAYYSYARVAQVEAAVRESLTAGGQAGAGPLDADLRRLRGLAAEAAGLRPLPGQLALERDARTRSQAELDRIKGQGATLTGERDALAAALGTAKAELSRAQGERMEFEQRARELEGALQARDAALQARGAEIAGLTGRLAAEQQARLRLEQPAGAERERLGRELEAARAALRGAEETLLTERGDKARLEARLRELETALQEAETQRSRLQELSTPPAGIDPTGGALVAASSELPAPDTAPPTADPQLTALRQELEGLQGERDVLAAHGREVGLARAALQRRAGELEAQLAAESAARAQAGQAATAAAGELARAREEAGTARQALEAAQAEAGRLAALQPLAPPAEPSEPSLADDGAAARIEAQSRELASLRLQLAERQDALAAVSPAAGPAPAPSNGEVAEAAVAAFKAKLADAPGIEPLADDRVVLTSATLFAPGEAELSPAGRTALAGLAERLKEALPEMPADAPWLFRIDGHTDDTPVRRSRFRSNWELSSARASAVAEYLVEQGLPSERLLVAGLAETVPLVPGRDEAARRRNRRIELRLVGG